MCDREAVDHLERPMSDYDLKADIGGRVRNIRFQALNLTKSGCTKTPFEGQAGRTLPEIGAAHQTASEPADVIYTALHRTH